MDIRNTNNPPGSGGTGEVHPEYRPQAPIRDFTKIAGVGMATCMLLDVGLSGGYIFASTTSDGVQPIDLLVTGGATAALGMGLHSLHKYGLKVLPAVKRNVRAKVLPIWAGLMGVTAATAMATSMLFAAVPAAEKANLTRQVAEAHETTNAAIRAQLDAEALIDVLSTKAPELARMAQLENSDGSICETGRGVGRCHAIIGNLALSTSRAADALIAQASSAKRALEQAERQKDELRRLSNRDDLTFSEYKVETQERIAAAAIASREILAGLPVATLEEIVSQYTRDFDSLDISAVGAKRIEAAVYETGELVRHRLGDLREAQTLDAPEFREPQSFEVLSAEWNSIWPILSILFLISAIPIALVVVNLIASTQDEGEDWEDDWSPPTLPPVVPAPHQPQGTEIAPEIDDEKLEALIRQEFGRYLTTGPTPVSAAKTKKQEG